jgi:hypothetical protein
MRKGGIATRYALVVLLTLCVATGVSAQWLNYPTPGIPRLPNGKPDVDAPALKGADGRPDLSGVWRRRTGGPDYSLNIAVDLSEVPLQPWASDLYKRRQAADRTGRPSERCLPHGIPTDMMIRETPFRIVQTPTLTIILLETFNNFRQVFTDGRGPLSEMQPTYLGYSRGRWEGDEFVVDTVGFNDETWLDNTGLPHSDALRLTERFKRLTVGRMNLTFTFDDPKAYTRPWSVMVALELLPDTDLLEYMCDNEKFYSKRLLDSSKTNSQNR